VGHWLRRFSLDELPQLFNVLRGEMSLIGPRPERSDYVCLFEEHVEHYSDRHRVKPGITGWAQVNGLRGRTSLRERTAYDNDYIAHWSPWLDVKIACLTVPAMLGGQHAE
jgi:lipopolysaccharide/colanic/teichoic acid biosynthesis glycosyltransferase